jgi:acetyltransferase-like isoleucine patch superfamily enzyme
LGTGSYIVDGIHGRFNTSSVHIGNFCSISHGFEVLTGGNHPLNLISTYPFARNYFTDLFDPHPPFGYSKGDVIIQNDVWIGQNVAVMSGIKINNGAIIGAYSVVTKDVPPYAMVAGNPATIKKYRFDDKTIQRLLKIAWWDWPVEKIKNAYDLFSNPDIELFLKTYEEEK